MSGTVQLLAGLAAGYAQAKRAKRMDDATADFRAKQSKLMDAQIAALQPKSAPKPASGWTPDYQEVNAETGDVVAPKPSGIGVSVGGPRIEDYTEGYACGGLVKMRDGGLVQGPNMMAPQNSDWQQRSFKKGCCGVCGGKHDGQC